MIDPDTMGQPGKRVKVPTLLIWGGEDRFLNISMAHRSAKYEIIIFLSFFFFF
jgi:pimeloyl-ACP methyl ester carboxylesterase